jgi:hypothetical protein
MVALLILTACYPAAPPPTPSFSRTLPGQGVDLATDAGGLVNEMQANRLEFVARYYREPESRWPPLSAGEAQLLSLAGLNIVAVWESHSRDPGHFSYDSGYHDATTAAAQARAIGQPPGSAIYFAVDYNVRDHELPAIDEYFLGIAAAFTAAGGGHPLYEVGVYGSGTVCAAIKGAGLARYSWLTNSIAWAGSTTYEDWNISQGGPMVGLSFNHDGDEAKEDYGGFRVAAAGLPGFAPPRFAQDGQSPTTAAAAEPR